MSNFIHDFDLFMILIIRPVLQLVVTAQCAVATAQVLDQIGLAQTLSGPPVFHEDADIVIKYPNITR